MPRSAKIVIVLVNWRVPMDDDTLPKKKPVHDIGQDLVLLSVNELIERVAILRAEIARIEAVMVSKQASRTVADQFFKK